jgi:CheY-like chemotaxis protein
MHKIFLAEDDIDDQELLAEAFQGIDPRVRLETFSTGKKFITHLDSLPDNEIPNMVILDYNIPEINGAEILKHLEEDDRYRNVIKLVWSTSNSSFYENSCLEHGAKAYMVKPSNLSGLNDLAKKMLDYFG